MLSYLASNMEDAPSLPCFEDSSMAPILDNSALELADPSVHSESDTDTDTTDNEISGSYC